MAETVINKNKVPLNKKLDLNLKKKLSQCWDRVVCGDETGTAVKVDQKYLQNFEVWCQREMEKFGLAIVLEIQNCYLESGCTLLVAQLVEELIYKPEGHGFDSRQCH